MSSPTSESILVTGATGFVASHLILQLLSLNYNVRVTIRDSSKESSVRQDLDAAGANNLANLDFFVADLTKDEGWDAAMDGCDYVHHVASPFPSQAPKDENELLKPAKEGTLRVLQAAARANVKRVVFTSSFAAIGYGKQDKDEFNEEDWSDPQGLPVYHKSKLFAERAAWDFVKQQQDSRLELVVINPVGIFGPVLGQKVSSSIGLIKTMLEGGMAACPRIYFNLVDVRDLAKLHILAMTHPKAGGERFIASGDGAPLSLMDVANIVRDQRPEKAAKVPKRQLQDWMVKAMGFVSPQVRSLVPQLGQRRPLSNLKAKRVLGWKPRTVGDCLGGTVDSLAQHKLI
ncbi:hypothetical protein BHE90_005309 [Fusarium euwallaceae]|uniref:NAD-dependent epimerase/dehydratase domain-containing protein n=1 Tax=Fusarium euwallaceae TaxID=1147111 RepID=A0A430LWT1_9HYPO|nr:hypothetical protein BHE90_005309 [Fusarium euwallaceae]